MAAASARRRSEAAFFVFGSAGIRRMVPDAADAKALGEAVESVSAPHSAQQHHNPPASASFHSCTRCTCSSYTVNGLRDLDTLAGSFGTPLTVGCGCVALPDLLCPSFLAPFVAGAALLLDDDDGFDRGRVPGDAALLRCLRACCIHACRRSFFALIRRCASFWKQ